MSITHPKRAALAAVLAMLIVAVSVFAATRPTAGRRPPEGELHLTAGGPMVHLDRGHVGRAAVRACFGTPASRLTPLYAVRQLTNTGTSPALVVHNRAGHLLLCDEFGRDHPSVVPIPHATQRRPVAYLSSGRKSWSCQGQSGLVRKLRMTEWLSVTPRVQAARLRFVVDGTPGHWFQTSRHGGVVHIQAWLTGRYPHNTRYAVQQRFLDGHGHRIRTPGVPARFKLAGCQRLGGVQIG